MIKFPLDSSETDASAFAVRLAECLMEARQRRSNRPARVLPAWLEPLVEDPRAALAEDVPISDVMTSAIAAATRRCARVRLWRRSTVRFPLTPAQASVVAYTTALVGALVAERGNIAQVARSLEMSANTLRHQVGALQLVRWNKKWHPWSVRQPRGREAREARLREGALAPVPAPVPVPAPDPRSRSRSRSRPRRAPETPPARRAGQPGPASTLAGEA